MIYEYFINGCLMVYVCFINSYLNDKHLYILNTYQQEIINKT